MSLMFLFIPIAQAQEIKTDSISGYIGAADKKTDSSRVAAIGTEASDEDAQKRMNEVWKRYSGYLNLSYALQSLKSDHVDLKSDLAFAMTIGKTYSLHKKPIAGIMKFGLDWSYIDISFAKYPDFMTSGNTPTLPEIGLVNLGIMQIEAGMGVGPSLTFNPAEQLKMCLYFHVTPSYSMMMQNHELYHHYATFFSVGLSISYKVISIGVENRWCGATNYGEVAMRRLNDIYDVNGNFQDPFESFGVKMKTTALRLYAGFRF